ncbi:hypothetical protein [Pelomonas cellulosilytica]|uniref:Uncharacterized protein n=1 Tax=Pelomonas cellulosilytica TaxID=2906762 RepID=A0ABS8XZR6_9BURK|nr:hypothetical protein [Pelomonas sp. P8]MCE4558107.1 hypothetical protein [Pelomonas sp. P8]
MRHHPHATASSRAPARQLQRGLGWLVFSSGSLVMLTGLLHTLRVSH